MSDARKGENNAMWGRKHSEETKKKIGEANTNPSEETRRKIGLCHIGKAVWKGRKHSDEAKKKTGDALRGKKRPPFTEVTRERMRIASTGRRHSLATKKRLSELHLGIPNLAVRGEKHGNWQGGITPINHKIRSSYETKAWRRKVLIRDGYKCQLCPQIGGELHVDHIKAFAFYPELRFEVSNGRTLCVSCHRKTDSYGGKLKINENNVFVGTVV